MDLTSVHAKKYDAAEQAARIAKELSSRAKQALVEPQERWASSAFRYHKKILSKLTDSFYELAEWSDPEQEQLLQLIESFTPIEFVVFDEEPTTYIYAAEVICKTVREGLLWIDQACDQGWPDEPGEPEEPVEAVYMLANN